MNSGSTPVESVNDPRVSNALRILEDAKKVTEAANVAARLDQLARDDRNDKAMRWTSLCRAAEHARLVEIARSERPDDAAALPELPETVEAILDAIKHVLSAYGQFAIDRVGEIREKKWKAFGSERGCEMIVSTMELLLEGKRPDAETIISESIRSGEADLSGGAGALSEVFKLRSVPSQFADASSAADYDKVITGESLSGAERETSEQEPNTDGAAKITSPSLSPQEPTSEGKSIRWRFETGLFWAGDHHYDCTPTPLAMLKYMVDNPLKTAFNVNDFRDLRGVDGSVLEPTTVARHVSNLRVVLREVARLIGMSAEIIEDPLPKQSGAWRFLLPR